MNFRKFGKIFDPRDHVLSHNCKEFAQSPQVLVFENFIRVYFSTREVDAPGKFRSHIAYADFTRDFRSVLDVSNHTILELGALGTFDEHGIFPLNVLRVEDRIYGYSSGISRRTSVPVETSIGFSVSNDNGKTFAKCGAGPILTSSLHEPFLVGDPFVNRYRDTFFMWFIYGVRWIRNEEDAPERVYKIGYAISEDGMDWRKQNRQIISDKLGPDECQALPTVVFHKDTYHMFFCYRSAVGFRDVRENMYKIGYAYSENLRDWTRDDGMFRFSGIDDDWDNEMQCYPYVFLLDEDLCMLYNGNKFGRYGFGLAVLEGEEKDNRRRVSVL